MKHGLLITLSLYAIAMVLFCAYHISIKKKNRGEVGTIVAEWPARFNLFSLTGIWSWSRVVLFVILALVLVMNSRYIFAGTFALLFAFSLVHEGLLQTVIGLHGVYYNDKLIYWSSVAAYTIHNRVRFKYLALQTKHNAKAIMIPLKPSEIETITRFIESHFTIDATLDDKASC